MIAQTVRWWDARLAAEMPDADTTVIVGFADDETDLGYWEGEHWRSQDNLAFANAVEFWCHLPAVPVRAVDSGELMVDRSEPDGRMSRDGASREASK